MITDDMSPNRTLLNLIYGDASRYIPTNELTEEQLEKLDNITYRWCNCKSCKRPLKIGAVTVVPQWAGHANAKTLTIRLSKPFLKQNTNPTVAITLSTFVHTVLHEIIHILFPEFNEEQTEKKTREWMSNPKFQLNS